MTRSEPTTRAARFTAFLTELPRGALSTLRHSLELPPGEYRPAFRYVEPFTPETISDREREAYYLTAGLYALTPDVRTARGVNFGQTFAQIDTGGRDRRFARLVDSDWTELPDQLRQAVRLAASHHAPFDWTRLLTDIHHWEHPTHTVQRQWLRAFHHALEDQKESP
ncbi:type I-E CRISPR-associated protein Cse2/CasB [Deinococcus soli (ex Cha et al. 2016)]|uniref:CRISPR system Cascade subunit CasB n=2 Tax=Deinococcus soli (ex Cha et al. 2016) TaxID=1309411 RepID=A0AAE4BNR4_9DEIO|nr:type I-E CRISPR-associated protein Cse2/CasB [Deinococcus soli (ex Cha et al. 2016)]MDR6218991.1 CRISPR system Cascade subunit CasB [Deinococcus soli (ex Cha et al. 2016)]MDR6328788.1 CRISPR system Cascade subunit CasB [Deinococcus soli (ex Cha et al. 2016)]MDR6751725.1 CRISPR system Cascade subunit CasB [Deinococcus soli (ex Cha et al. 2016)]